MTTHDEASDRPLHQEYERVKRHSRSRGADGERAKREAAEAVHRERRQERTPERTPLQGEEPGA